MLWSGLFSPRMRQINTDRPASAAPVNRRLLLHLGQDRSHSCPRTIVSTPRRGRVALFVVGRIEAGVTPKIPRWSPAAAADVGHPLDRRHDVGMVDLAHQPHAGREVVGANEDAVDPRDRRDRCDVFDRPGVLRLDDHERLLVRRSDVRLELQAVAVRRGDPTPTPHAEVAAVLDDAVGLLGGVDLRDDDPRRAKVESPLDRDLFARRDADKTGNAAAGRLQHPLQFRRLEQAVLGIDEQPVESASARISATVPAGTVSIVPSSRSPAEAACEAIDIRSAPARSGGRGASAGGCLPHLCRCLRNETRCVRWMVIGVWRFA